MPRDNKDIVMKCSRCPNQAPVNQMRYGKDGKSLVCPACQGLTADQIQKMNVAKEQITSTGQMKSYKCTSCSYSFTRSTLTPTKCPYCGKQSVVEASAMASHKLLDDD